MWGDAEDEKSSMLLVMRVLSIVPLNFKVRERMRGARGLTGCAGTGVVCAVVTRVARVQLVCAVADAGTADVVGGDDGEHAATE